MQLRAVSVHAIISDAYAATGVFLPLMQRSAMSKRLTLAITRRSFALQKTVKLAAASAPLRPVLGSEYWRF